VSLRFEPSGLLGFEPQLRAPNSAESRSLIGWAA
jgi:hypothetical protein